MSRTKPIDDRLLTKVSSMYYDEDYNQQQIATRLQLSRPKVSRLLKKARDKGIVQITVVSPNGNYLDLEKGLEEKYQLKEVIIVDLDELASSKTIKRQLGSAAANYLLRTISNGDTVGASWGTTLQAMIDAMQPKKIEGVHVVQTLGGVGPPEAKAHATDISRRISQLLEGRLTLLPAPGIVGSAQAKKILLSEKRVRAAVDLFTEIDTLFVGIGAIDTNPVLKQNSDEIPAETQKEIIASDAVGDIALHFYDIDGNEIDSSLKELVIGISTEEIKHIENVVGIAGGTEKLDAVQGALNSGLINVLITDSQTAVHLNKES